MKNGRGFKTVIFLGRYGVVVFGSWDLSERVCRRAQNQAWPCRKSSLALPKLVPHFCRRLTLLAVISECGKTSVTSLNSAQLQITDLSSSKQNKFFNRCVFSPTTPLKIPTRLLNLLGMHSLNSACLSSWVAGALQESAPKHPAALTSHDLGTLRLSSGNT